MLKHALWMPGVKLVLQCFAREKKKKFIPLELIHISVALKMQTLMFRQNILR